MPFISIRYVPIVRMENDFTRVGKEAVPVVADTLETIGEDVLAESRRRFVEYGGGKTSFIYSAENMRTGVVTGRARASTAVGQTLPRSPIVEKRRPNWSLLQYQKALGPAVDDRLTEATDDLGRTQRDLLIANRFV